MLLGLLWELNKLASSASKRPGLRLASLLVKPELDNTFLLPLGLQIAQSRSYTLGTKVGAMYILGVLSYIDIKEVQAADMGA